MTLISNLFANRWIDSLGWTLLHSLWQSALILVIVLAILRVVHSHRSRLRYATMCAGFFLFLASAIGTFLYLGTHHMPVDDSTATFVVRNIYVSSPEVVSHRSADFLSSLNFVLQQSMPAFLGLWAVGFVFFAFRLFTGFFYTYKMRSTGIAVKGRWVDFVAMAANRMGIERFISLAESATISAPIVIGYFKPIILIPVGMMSGLTTEQLETVILHELAHIKRHDYLVNLIQSVVEAIFFFNPFVWIMSKLIRREREYCCDDMVVHMHGSKKAYAYALTQLAEVRLTAAYFALSLGEDKNQLLNRIRRIMEKSARNYPVRSQIAVPVILLIGALFCISWLGIGGHNGITGEAVVRQDTVPAKKPNAARYSRKSIITLDENGQPHEEVVEEFEGDESLRPLLQQHAVPGISAIPAVPGIDVIPPMPDMYSMPADTIPFGFNTEEWETMTKSFEDLQKQLELMHGYQEGDSTDMLPGWGRMFSLPGAQGFQFPDHFFESLGDLDRSDAFEDLQENLRHLEGLQMENFGDFERQFQQHPDQTSSYEHELRDQLEKDGYLSADESISSLEWNNDTFKVNGKGIRPQDREKYRKLNDQFFGAPNRTTRKSKLE
jgi:bla regulator protein blaR1